MKINLLQKYNSGHICHMTHIAAALLCAAVLCILLHRRASVVAEKRRRALCRRPLVNVYVLHSLVREARFAGFLFFFGERLPGVNLSVLVDLIFTRLNLTLPILISSERINNPLGMKFTHFISPPLDQSYVAGLRPHRIVCRFVAALLLHTD